MFIISKMFAITCEKGSAGLSSLLHVAVRAGQLIDATLVKSSRRSGGLVYSVVG